MATHEPPRDPVIDAWIQHPTPAMLRDPMFDSLRRWIGADALPPGGFPLALTRGLLDAGRVDHALITAWYGPRGPLVSNDEVAAYVAAMPGRLSGVASVDLSRPVAAVRELRRAVGELGFKALRMLPWLWDRPPDDRLYYPLYAACVDLGVPFCLQVGHTGPLAPSEWGRPIPYLDRVALDFPELVIVGGHIGYPWTEEMIALARKHENVWIDTSAYKPSRYPAALVEYLRTSRAHKVLFGSNAPMLAPAACLAEVPALGLSDAARRRFLSENARAVFGLAEPAGAPATRVVDSGTGG
ncbi:MAG: amidohydrolase [Myxococcales bacterium]|nr:amidohydrolase [Myxococcales bacterium]MCB9732784.1 amidohydrolase [Deltaproteobacteria bacterium]